MYKSINCEITFFFALSIFFFLHTKSIWASLCEEGVPLNKLLAKFVLKINSLYFLKGTVYQKKIIILSGFLVCFRFDVLHKDSSAQSSDIF